MPVIRSTLNPNIYPNIYVTYVNPNIHVIYVYIYVIYVYAHIRHVRIYAYIFLSKRLSRTAPSRGGIGPARHPLNPQL